MAEKTRVESGEDPYREGRLTWPKEELYIYFSSRLKNPINAEFCVTKRGWSYPASDFKPIRIRLKELARSNKIVIGRTQDALISEENDYLNLENSERRQEVNRVYTEKLQYLDRGLADYETLLREYLRDNLWIKDDERDLPLDWFNDPAISRKHGILYFLERDGVTGLYFKDTSTNGVMIAIDVKNDREKMEKYLKTLMNEWHIDRESQLEVIKPEKFSEYLSFLRKTAESGFLRVYSRINSTIYNPPYSPNPKNEETQRLLHLPVILDVKQQDYAMIYLGSLIPKEGGNTYKNRIVISTVPLNFSKGK